MDIYEEPEPVESEEPMEDEELEDVESPRASLAPKGKPSNKKRKRTSSEDSSVEDNSPKGDKKKVKGPLSNTNKSINVGKDFQAVIEENDDLTNFRDYTPDREQAYWEHHGDVDTDELENFVNEKSAKYLVPIDRVLFILMEKKMNYREAAVEIAKRNILQDGWKDDERFAFENSFTHVGKNFHQMHAAIAHRSLRSIIHYYYDSKKSITYRAFATKSITEVETLEEYEPAVEKQPQGVFENMCENCGERAERMMWNEQMNRIECNACLIYFRNMLVPRPTSLRLVMDERFDGQIPCPDTMRDMMKCYNRLSAPATGKTFELRKVKELFSMDQLTRTRRSNCKRFRIPQRFMKTDLKNLPINRSFYIGGAPSTSNGAFDRAFDTLNGVVEKLEREMNALPLTVDVTEPVEEGEEAVVVEEVQDQGLLMAVGSAVGSVGSPDEEAVEEPKTETEEAPEASEAAPGDAQEVKQEESPEEPAPEAESNSENPSEEPPKDSSESPEKSESSESSGTSKESSSEEATQNPEAPKSPEAPEDSKETPRSSESPEKSPEKSTKKKKSASKKVKINLSNLTETSSKKSKKSRKSIVVTDPSLPSSSNGTTTSSKPSGRPPGGPSMYIWHNKRKTQCQEEIEVLLDDSRRKLFEAGQHSSKIDYKQVNNWKNDMAALRERMHRPNLDMDLYPQIVYAGERTRFARDWTDEDHKNVQRLFRWYGPNFQQIADVMGNKTADQVYNFYLTNQEAIELDHEEFTRHAGKAVELADERKGL